MVTYSIQVICFQAIFMAAYYLLLRKETFFTYNRIYLLVTLCISFVVPFLKIPFLQTSTSAISLRTLLPEIIIGTPEVANDISKAGVETTQAFDIPLLLIYITGIIISLIILSIKIYKISKLYTYRKKGEKVVEIPNSNVAFALFNHIFIGANIDALSRKQILNHEHIHLKQKHTWDLVLLEILRVVMWFNPLVYIFQNQLSVIHEYLADQKAIHTTTKKVYYEELLNASFGSKNISFTNTFFNHSLIKKRIIMLQKSKSKKTALIKYTFFIPLLLAMLLYVSCSEDNTSLVSEEQSIEQQIEELRARISNRDNITQEEYDKFVEFSKEVIDKTTSVKKVYTSNTDESKELLMTKEVVLDSDGNVPFAVIDEVPVFPGCESLATNEERKECMSQRISKFVNRNFNTGLGKELNLTDVNRIFVSFEIDKNGLITNLRSRSPHPDLGNEAERVIKLLPKMLPGKQDGKPVNVLYALPITFKIAE